MSKAPAPAKAPTTAQPTTASISNVEKFWDEIEKIRAFVATKDFGASVGQGGSDIKNSHQLFHQIRPMFIEAGIIIDIAPRDLQLVDVGSTAVAGMYDVKFIMKGDVVYETTSFGAHSASAPAQATHGSATAAKTALYFNLLFASVKSEDDMIQDAQNEENRQAKRAPAKKTEYGAKPKGSYGY